MASYLVGGHICVLFPIVDISRHLDAVQLNVQEKAKQRSTLRLRLCFSGVLHVFNHNRIKV